MGMVLMGVVFRGMVWVEGAGFRVTVAGKPLSDTAIVEIEIVKTEIAGMAVGRVEIWGGIRSGRKLPGVKIARSVRRGMAGLKITAVLVGVGGQRIGLNGARKMGRWRTPAAIA